MSIKRRIEEAYRAAAKLSPKCPLAFFGKPSHHDMQASVDGRHEMLLSVADTFSLMRWVEKTQGKYRLRMLVYHYLDYGPSDGESFIEWHKKEFGVRPKKGKASEYQLNLQRVIRAWQVREERLFNGKG